METSHNPEPLLAEEKDKDRPALLGGGGDHGHDATEQSPLERLIAHSTSEQAAAAAAAASTMETSVSPFLVEGGNNPLQASFMDDNHRAEGDNLIPSIDRTFATLLAGSLCLLQIGLVWGSFLSNAWFDTHLQITVGSGLLEEWSQQLKSLLSMPSTKGLDSLVDFSTDQVLQETTLASLLSMLLGADQHWVAMGLVLTCLIFPCLCMILCPSWTINDYQEATSTDPRPSQGRAQQSAELLLGFSPRILVENSLARICLLAFFMLAILDVGTSSLALENNRTEFLITNRTRGGLVCYTVGIACAMGVIVVLRLASHPIFVPRNNASTEPSLRFPLVYAEDERQPRAPPRQAFEGMHQPLLADETDSAENPVLGAQENNQAASQSFSRSDMPFFQKIVVFELSIMTAILWLPALFLPLFEITFDGLVASFMEEVSFTVAFYQIPTALYQRGIAAKTDHWMLIAVGVVLILNVYILPLVATAAAIGAWRTPRNSQKSYLCRSLLRFLQPCLCGIVFSLAVLMAIPAFEPLGEYLIDTQTAGFCQRFENVTDTPCLMILGSHCIGQWFLLGHSLALEMLVVVTLAWL